MEEKKSDISESPEEPTSLKLFPHSILLVKGPQEKRNSIKIPRKSKSLNLKEKRVSFADRIKKPLHIIYEVEPIIYEDFEIGPKKKQKSKGCACSIF